MLTRKERFIQVMCDTGMLRFGAFVTKAGRNSPYFINSGEISTSQALRDVGKIYAEMICEYFPTAQKHLYGPAYKGIPLAVTTASALADLGHMDYTVTFNRKEAKDHGEGGHLIGYLPKAGDEVILIEDVVSKGTSLRESLALLQHLHVKVRGLVVGVDREERGEGKLKASEEIAQIYGIEVRSVVTIREILHYLGETDRLPKEYRLSPNMVKDVQAYLEQWS